MIKKRQLLQQVKIDFKGAISNKGLNEKEINNLIKKYSAQSLQVAIFCLQYLSRLINQYQKQTTLTIESSQPLTSSEQSQLAKQFSHTHQINLIDAKVNPSLFAGIRVRIGDDVYEDSLLSRLNQLKGAIAS